MENGSCFSGGSRSTAWCVWSPAPSPRAGDARICGRQDSCTAFVPWTMAVRQNTGKKKRGKPGKAKKHWESNWTFGVNVRVMFFFNVDWTKKYLSFPQERGRKSDSEHLSLAETNLWATPKLMLGKSRILLGYLTWFHQQKSVIDPWKPMKIRNFKQNLGISAGRTTGIWNKDMDSLI